MQLAFRQAYIQTNIQQCQALTAQTATFVSFGPIRIMTTAKLNFRHLWTVHKLERRRPAKQLLRGEIRQKLPGVCLSPDTSGIRSAALDPPSSRPGGYGSDTGERKP